MKHSIVLGLILSIGACVFVIAGNVSASAAHVGTTGAGAAYASPLHAAPTSTPMAMGRAATPAELAKARAEWATSAHADTYDKGQGANATCAQCKSPRNWDVNMLAASQALDCGACKRVPGAPRPDLESGVPVAQADWKNIGCDVCHQPIGDSYSITPAFWNNATQAYEPVQTTTDLCAECHEGQHGFEVIEEQQASTAHKGWDCTRCHGVHHTQASCTDCHNPTQGRGADVHARHPQVNCTACHDAGGLGVALETDAPSRLAARHEGTYITMRFAHTITSWPSHDLQLQVDCRRCHHPQAPLNVPVAASVGCDNGNCHAQGASLNWCPVFPRNPPPGAGP